MRYVVVFYLPENTFAFIVDDDEYVERFPTYESAAREAANHPFGLKYNYEVIKTLL